MNQVLLRLRWRCRVGRRGAELHSPLPQL